MDPMQHALDLARGALGTTSPNPAVGAVVVRDGEVVGEGWTQPPGGPHAEVIALRQAGEQARGATLYVTLEPCCHHGRTPPCTDAILQAGVAAVCAAIRDPNPKVNGGGVAVLEAGGVQVDVGRGAEEAQAVLEGYLKWVATAIPFVVAKFAMSLDGKIATVSGESQWITGEASRRYAHELRRATDAIAVGIGTALHDDPQLTARDPSGQAHDRQPLRVVVDSQGRVPPDSRLFARLERTVVAVASLPEERERALGEAGAEVVRAPARDGRVHLQAVLKHLGREGVTTLLVEGGGTLLASFFEAGLVDKVEVFVAPLVIGGRDALTPVEGEGVTRLADALRLERVSVEQLGDDIHIVGYPQRKA